MNKCTRAPTHTCVNEFSCRRQAPAYYFSSPGPSRAVCCVSMSKSAQAERKTKARFQALLRRSRFSRRSLRERLWMNHTAKLRTKKMRSNLLKRIQKQNSESPSKIRNFWYQTFCLSETKSETFSETPWIGSIMHTRYLKSILFLIHNLSFGFLVIQRAKI